MPKRDLYYVKEPLNERFAAMSDQEFLAFARQPGMDQIYQKYTVTQRTAFLNRALMMGEDPDALARELNEGKSCVLAFGPAYASDVLEAWQGEKNPYSSARHFQFAFYRELLYNEEVSRALAETVEQNMSPLNMVQQASRLRQTLFAHLFRPVQYLAEGADAAKEAARPAQDQFQRELRQGGFRAKIGPEKPTEDYTVSGNAAGAPYSFRIRVLPEGEPALALLDGYEDPQTTDGQREEMLLSYAFRGMPRAQAEQRIREIQDNVNIRQNLTDCARYFGLEQVRKHAELLGSYLRGEDNMAGMRLGRLVVLEKKNRNMLTQEEQERENKRYIPREEKKTSVKTVQMVQEDKKREQIRSDEFALRQGEYLAQDASGRSWKRYAELHQPDPERQYSEEEKQVLLSKQMIARWRQRRNGVVAQQNVLNKVFSVFRLDSARKDAEKLRKCETFKGLVRSELVDEYLSKNGQELAAAAENCVKPFNSRISPFEKRQQVLSTLTDMLPWLTPKENRSPEWKRFRDSMEALADFEPVDNDDPAQNGADRLQAVYQSCLDYMKGKKSLRGSQAKQDRFDQTLDVLVELGKASPYANMAKEAVLDRITAVRRKHDRHCERVWDFDYGAKKIQRHGRLQPEPEQQEQKLPDDGGISLK